ncbi:MULTISPECIES: EI24 domain-containing protein [Anaeromyxobacter]|uniref:EI24 domain-containing protein n=1 Tax=Anaeromyxobacter TaxID=161492 RepID=UPI001F564279|nr:MULTISPECIES: EI24 domain-containing protein [unclassified Anaeromyxobacter]
MTGAGSTLPPEDPLAPPPLDGPRAAARAIAWYASNPAAAPRVSRLDRALYGVAQVLHAARLVAGDPALRRAALVPTAITFAGCALLATLATARADDPDPAGTFHAFLVTFVALASMPPTLLQRLWLRVALEARRALGLPPGEDAFADVGYVRLVVAESAKALRQAIVVSIGIAPLLILVRILPFGTLEATLLAGAWAFYWLVVDALELPIEVLSGPRTGGPSPWYSRLLARAGRAAWVLRPFSALARFLDRLTRPWREEVAFTERHRFETLGLGVAVGAVLVIPVVGLFFRAIAIVASTAAVGRLDAETPPGS